MDVLAAALFVASMVVLGTGGGVVWLGPLRLSMRSAARPFLWALILAAVRYWFVRQRPVFLPVVFQWRPPLPSGEQQLVAPAPLGLKRRAVEFALVTLGFTAFVAIATWPQVAQPYAVSDMGDPLFSIWRLSWLAHELPRNPLNIFNGNQLYPEPRTLTFSDPTLAPSLLFAPLTALGLHRIVAYNVVFLTGGVFSGVSMFYLVRALTGRTDAAWVSGAIFAMHPYRVEHLAHLELQMTMWMPVVLWLLHRTIATGRLRDGVLTGLAFAAQMYSALYYGAFLIPFCFVVGTIMWLAHGRPLRPLRALAVGAVLGALLFAPVAVAYARTRPYMGDRPVEAVSFYSATGSDYLNAHYRSLTYGWLSKDAIGERALFPRIAPVVLTAVALFPPLSAARIAYALAVAMTLEASLGFNGSVFPFLYYNVPPFGGIRVPARFSVALGLALAVLAGYGVARLVTRWPRWRAAIIAVALAAVTVEALPQIKLERPWLEPPPIYAPLVGQPPSVLAEFPMPPPGEGYLAEFNYLYFSTFHWQKLVNGQSGWLPPTYIELLVQQKDFPSDSAVAYLRKRGVQYITVHGRFYPPEQLPQVLAVLDARSDIELVTAAPWEGRESRLYRLR